LALNGLTVAYEKRELTVKSQSYVIKKTVDREFFHLVHYFSTYFWMYTSWITGGIMND
jgi:hypothetical protein